MRGKLSSRSVTCWGPSPQCFPLTPELVNERAFNGTLGRWPEHGVSIPVELCPLCRQVFMLSFCV